MAPSSARAARRPPPEEEMTLLRHRSCKRLSGCCGSSEAACSRGPPVSNPEALCFLPPSLACFSPPILPSSVFLTLVYCVCALNKAIFLKTLVTISWPLEAIFSALGSRVGGRWGGHFVLTFSNKLPSSLQKVQTGSEQVPRRKSGTPVPTLLLRLILVCEVGAASQVLC